MAKGNLVDNARGAAKSILWHSQLSAQEQILFTVLIMLERKT